MQHLLRAAVPFLLLTPAAAQVPSLRSDAAVQLSAAGAAASYTLTATPGAMFAVFADVSSGPVRVLGERFDLGFTPALVTFETAISIGVQSRVFRLPPTLPIGEPVYLQAVVVDAFAPNGLFRVSNGESIIPYAANESVLVERFDDPLAGGLTGNFDGSVRGRLQGGAVRRRVHQTIVDGSVPFESGLANPLNPSGSRLQMVFRDTELGATGEIESVVAIRWAATQQPISFDQFGQLELRLAPTRIRPDYTVSPFTALPAFPQSGLSVSFLANLLQTEPLQLAYSGPYTVDPRDVVSRLDPLRGTTHRYMPYPSIRPVTYPGEGSLLLEIAVPAQAAAGANGQQVYLPITSSPLPGSRAVAAGSVASPLADPNAVVVATNVDNAVYNYEFEFLRTRTSATSDWLFARSGADYGQPYVASTVPAGTSLTLQYRGADDATGRGATAWSANIDGADGKPFVQYRAEFVANAVTSEVPSIDTLLVPYR